MIIEEEDLLHYGILRKSGRYPWGSGENAEQRSRSFLEVIEDLKRRFGWSDSKIGEMFSSEDQKLSSTDIRAMRVIAKKEIKAAEIAMAQRLKDKGMHNTAAAARMGIPESSYRALLAPGAADKADLLTKTADRLRDEINEKKYLDVGSGQENYLGVSKERKDIAIAMLVEEGYTKHYIKLPQPGTGKDTTTLVMAPPGTPWKEVNQNKGLIRSLQTFSDDGGRTYYGIAEPLSINPKRLKVVYGEEGGGNLDGVIFVRPGVDDVSLGGNRYAQVRIKVGDNHYIKGMAIYKEGLPEGVDLVFNTAKSDTGNKTDALKPLTDDPDNPFGSYIRRQILVKDKDGKDVPTSVMNLVNEEGSWGGGRVNPKTGEIEKGWSDSIASQVLSKQSPDLAKAQLSLTFERRQKEFDEIMALTNPTVKKKLLEEFADATDSASVHLKAAALPRQNWQVILPINSLADNEVYAPNFRDGERVALIRYPHGGTFEIPDLVVNNRHAESKRILGTQPKDAIGINTNVAQRLSGADFDGDTVLVIPNNAGKIRITPALKDLKGFDPRSSYPPYDGMRTVDGGIFDAKTGKVDYGGKKPTDRKQREMGDVSNLITDMTIKGASHDKIARAVKHSMVVIDAEKHHLNYKQSAIDNGIAKLKEEYQGSSRSGASTLISRAKSPVRIPERVERKASLGGPVDKATGKKVYVETNRTYVNKKGEVVPSTTKLKALQYVESAHELSSGTRIEKLYADHSDRLKAMSNEARRIAVNTPPSKSNELAAKTYANEVASLNAKLDLAIRNRPLERQALALTTAVVKQKRDANPDMDKETRKKIEYQALEEMRNRTGAKRHKIEVTPKEWEAIQAGAISNTKLNNILRNANMDVIRQHATPRKEVLMTSAATALAKQMLASGYTRAEIADRLGVSLTTLDKATVGE